MILPPQCCWAGCRGATGEDSFVQGTRSRRSEHRFLSQYRYTASYSVSAPPARRRLAHPGPQTFSQVLTGNFYTIHHCIYKVYNILLRRFSEPMLMLVCYSMPEILILKWVIIFFISHIGHPCTQSLLLHCHCHQPPKWGFFIQYQGSVIPIASNFFPFRIAKCPRIPWLMVLRNTFSWLWCAGPGSRQQCGGVVIICSTIV